MSTEYPIRTVNDFLTVPADRREAMLADLSEWMKLRDRIAPLVAAGQLEVPDVFRWLDDGAVGLSQINITIQASVTDKPEDGKP